MLMAKRVVGIMAWVVILGLMVPAFKISNFIADTFDGFLGLVLLVVLMAVYVVSVGVGIFLLDVATRRLSARYGWNYEEDTKKLTE